MMGRRQRDQGRLFYEFRLEDRIPENHLLRRINVFVSSIGLLRATAVLFAICCETGFYPPTIPSVVRSTFSTVSIQIHRP